MRCATDVLIPSNELTVSVRTEGECDNATAEIPSNEISILVERPREGERGTQGPVGPGVPAGGTLGQALFKGPGGDYDTAWADLPLQVRFETVSKNLASNPYALNYTMGVLTSIVYTVGAGTITKTLGYASGKLVSIVLSGDTPAGIQLTKTLTYTGDALTGVAYS
jgi:hypothetical protein